MIVIPMSGLSQRFINAGYNKPKYMLEAKGMSLFEHSLLSFDKYFSSEPFLFIALRAAQSDDFIRSKATSLGIKEFHICLLDEPTLGQAETVYLGLKSLCSKDDFPITIFNIDTFRPGFVYPLDFDINDVDGYLETFVGSGKNWSNVLPDPLSEGRVKLTAEKAEISNLCCTGLYYFKSCDIFCEFFEKVCELGAESMHCGEYYVAPIYNDLILGGLDIRYSVVDSAEVVFCGTPDEYISFLSS